jgi:hypothetical protein
MKKEYFTNAVRMLKNQLMEEKDHYEKALTDEKHFFKLKPIKQRINSLEELLFSMERKQEPSFDNSGRNSVAVFIV